MQQTQDNVMGNVIGNAMNGAAAMVRLLQAHGALGYALSAAVGAQIGRPIQDSHAPVSEWIA